MQFPAKAAFFCPHCVSGDKVKVDAFGDPTPCHHCNNNRIITMFENIDVLTKDFVKVKSTVPEERTYYVMLLSHVELYDNVITDFNEESDTVRGARYIKDRFFFSIPLPDDLLADSFFTTLAWIPKE